MLLLLALPHVRTGTLATRVSYSPFPPDPSAGVFPGQVQPHAGPPPEQLHAGTEARGGSGRPRRPHFPNQAQLRRAAAGGPSPARPPRPGLSRPSRERGATMCIPHPAHPSLPPLPHRLRRQDARGTAIPRREPCAVRCGRAGAPLPRRGPAPAERRRQSLRRCRRCPCSAGQAGGAAGSVHAWCVDESQQAAAGGGGGRGRRLGGAALGSTLFSILMRAERGLWIFTLRREPPPFIHPHGPRAWSLLPPGPAFAPLPSPSPASHPPSAPPRSGAAPLRRAGHAAPGPREEEKEEEGRWWRRPLAVSTCAAGHNEALCGCCSSVWRKFLLTDDAGTR
ncbi:cadherin-related family member 5-like isoform X2 [Manacus candei]|uniref:cadherin-related family member 5-like isoform X2 n=1 Tax=Manacus candei TaxID=415023 RepID=UPI0022262732|nr:cadherin-related family member 5-like isoform X2 [Manacus candei]